MVNCSTRPPGAPSNFTSIASPVRAYLIRWGQSFSGSAQTTLCSPSFSSRNTCGSRLGRCTSYTRLLSRSASTMNSRWVSWPSATTRLVASTTPPAGTEKTSSIVPPNADPVQVPSSQASRSIFGSSAFIRITLVHGHRTRFGSDSRRVRVNGLVGAVWIPGGRGAH